MTKSKLRTLINQCELLSYVVLLWHVSIVTRNFAVMETVGRTNTAKQKAFNAIGKLTVGSH